MQIVSTRPLSSSPAVYEADPVSDEERAPSAFYLCSFSSYFEDASVRGKWPSDSGEGFVSHLDQAEDDTKGVAVLSKIAHLRTKVAIHLGPLLLSKRLRVSNRDQLFSHPLRDDHD